MDGCVTGWVDMARNETAYKNIQNICSIYKIYTKYTKFPKTMLAFGGVLTSLQ